MAIMSAIREQRFEAIVERERESGRGNSLPVWGNLKWKLERRVRADRAWPYGKIKADKVMAGCPS